MQRALGSVFGNVGGNVPSDIISCEKQHQGMSADTMNGWENKKVPSQRASCDTWKNGK